MHKYIILSTGLLLTISTATFAAGQHDNHHHEQDTQHQTEHNQMVHGDMLHHGPMASAVGMPAPVEQATQTINVSLTDDMKMQFSPTLNIKQGDIIRFVVTNHGNMPHEFSIGSIDEQDKHRAMMRAMPNMKHSDGTTLSLQPGETAELGWHFMGQNFVEFSCNIPGHTEAGMKMNYILR